jgi:hypothetical protein
MLFLVGGFMLIVFVTLVLFASELGVMRDSIEALEGEVDELKNDREGCVPDFFKDIHPTDRIESQIGREFPILPGDTYPWVRARKHETNL